VEGYGEVLLIVDEVFDDRTTIFELLNYLITYYLVRQFG
jgi:hypoxanthine phosphoribosyltransferase